MSDPYAQLTPPPSNNDYPDRIKFESVGQSVEGILTDVRMKPAKGDMGECPVIAIQQPSGQTVAVFCNPISLWRQLDAARPALGSMIRVTFVGWEGQAKVFRLDVAPDAAGVNSAPQAPAAAPAQPEGWSQPGAPAAPWGQAPAAPAAPTNGAPAPPWGS